MVKRPASVEQSGGDTGARSYRRERRRLWREDMPVAVVVELGIGIAHHLRHVRIDRMTLVDPLHVALAAVEQCPVAHGLGALARPHRRPGLGALVVAYGLVLAVAVVDVERMAEVVLERELAVLLHGAD